MSDVLFEEEKSYSTPPQHVGNTSVFVTYAKKFGFAKTDKEAEMVLLGLALAAVVLGGIIALVSFGGSDKPVELPPEPLSIEARPPTI